MTAKRVIPCLDVDAGRVVKGVRFRELRDAGDPAELAALYDREGADELVFLDITATSGGRKILLDAVARTADQVFIPLTVGGGIRSVDDVAERGETDDEKSHPSSFILRRISVVECSFASPTITTLPPYAFTTSRSGTVSGV